MLILLIRRVKIANYFKETSSDLTPNPSPGERGTEPSGVKPEVV
jgi:hypothetical protein